jgi:phospholipid/cholesterol/gamma-HCH transport system substrate-binding protein
MRMRTIEIAVGAFMLAGIFAAVFLAVRVSGINSDSDDGGFRLFASFQDVSGLRVRSKVSIAGVTIGRVTDVAIDPETQEAVVEMRIRDDVDYLTPDTAARVLTEGVLGVRYIGLAPGFEDGAVLADGDLITETQGAIVLEDLIGAFISRAGS